MCVLFGSESIKCGLILNGTSPMASKDLQWTIGISFVVLIERVETLVPALDPIYGIPSWKLYQNIRKIQFQNYTNYVHTSRTRRLMHSKRLFSCNFLSKRNVFPPPIKMHCAWFTASIGFFTSFSPFTVIPKIQTNCEMESQLVMSWNEVINTHPIW